MPQRGFVVEQNPLNTALSWPFYRDWPVGFFARWRLVTMKSLWGNPSVHIPLVSSGVSNQLKELNPVCWGQGESIDTHIVKVFDKNEKGTLQHPRCLSIYWDQSQLKMSIPDYWGQGISIETHIAKVCSKSEKGTLAHPWCPQCGSQLSWLYQILTGRVLRIS